MGTRCEEKRTTNYATLDLLGAGTNGSSEDDDRPEDHLPRRQRPTLTPELRAAAEAALAAGLVAARRRPGRDTIAGRLESARLAEELAAGLMLLARDHVRAAHHLGATWADIGIAFDVTRQTAHQHFR